MRDDDKPFTEADQTYIKLALAEIDHCDSGSIEYAEDDLIEWSGDTRWALPEAELSKIAATAKCKIRAIGREDGCAFIQVFCFDETGSCVQDQIIEYAF